MWCKLNQEKPITLAGLSLTLTNWLIVLVLVCSSLYASGSHASSNVVVTLSPIHSITSAITKGARDPDLLIDKQGSAHHLSLRPSQARMLQNAELVIRVSAGLESFLDQTLQSMGGKSRLLTLATIDSSSLLAIRESLHLKSLGNHSLRNNSEHGAQAGNSDGNAANNADSIAIDTHLWMSPQIVKQWVKPIALELSQLDPQYAELYQLNASELIQRLDELDKHIAESIEAIEKPVLVVYHDSYQYFEKRYGLQSVAALHDHADNRVGARSLQALFKQLEAHDTDAEQNSERFCLLVPPAQLEAGIVEQLTDNDHLRIVKTDPLGWHFKPGPDFYFEMMRELADGLSACAS